VSNSVPSPSRSTPRRRQAKPERSLISERTRAGVKAAQRRGVKFGRKPKLTPQQIAHAAAAGAEIDLLLEIPGHGMWAVEIKRSLAGRPEKGFYIACQDLMPERRFVVNAGSGHYPIDAEITAIGLYELAAMLAALAL